MLTQGVTTKRGYNGLYAIVQSSMFKIQGTVDLRNQLFEDFEVRASGKTYAFPYVKVRPRPASDDQVTRVYLDRDLGAVAH